MLMSQGAASAGAIGWPNCGACPNATAGAATIAAQRSRRSSIHIGKLPFFVNAPALDGVVMIIAAEAALLAEGRARWLHHAGIVGGAALQHGGPSVPLPGHAEARERLRQDGAVERGLGPALAAVGRDLDLPDAAVARPGEAGNLVEARALEREPRRRMGDDRFHFERED